MKKLTVFGFISILSLLFPFLCSGAQTKGIKVIVKDTSGRKVALYKESHALLIGISDYTAGWPKLESVPFEISKVEAALKKRGFHVVKVMNPTSDELSEAFEDFIDAYGFDEGNRLLFFFSGHGHTRKGGKKGYLVPADAPDPQYDEKGFARKAIGMNQILTWSREIESKHALFLFDSCFSGTIFKARALPRIPPDISDVTSRPVRQFISAGSAGEEVPASSVFTPSFIRALQGDGDLDKDGYITGTEIGMYLHKKVLSYEKDQTPQYGKIKDPDLDEGDFVFILERPDAIKTPSTQGIQPPGQSVPQNSMDKEMLFWQSIQDSQDPSLFKAYIRAFPEGVFAPIAKAKVEALKRKQDMASIPPANLKSKLFVDVEPTTATIRILNIKPKFHQGMTLEPGSYHIEVSKDGYKTKKTWVSLEEKKDKRIKIGLEQLRASIDANPYPLDKPKTIGNKTRPPTSNKKRTYTVLLSENFSNNSFRWPVGSKNERDIKIRNGKYYFRHKQDKKGYTISKEIKGFNALSNFRIHVTAKHLTGIVNNGFGIVWGKKGNSSHHFRISANGHFKLAKNLNGKFIDISGWQKSSKIHKNNRSNSLSVEKRGKFLYCYINGARVYKSAFEPFSGNRVGVRIDNKQAVEFDNIIVKVER